VVHKLFEFKQSTSTAKHWQIGSIKNISDRQEDTLTLLDSVKTFEDHVTHKDYTELAAITLQPSELQRV